MSLAAIVQAMADAGCTAQQIAAAVSAYEANAPSRSKHAEAQARYRAKKAAQKAKDDYHQVIMRDHADHHVSPEKKAPPHPLKENPLPKENPPKGGQKKGVRLPADWQPSAEDRAYGGKLGFSTSEIDGMAEDLRLWACAASGQVALKRDWSSAFKGWMRRESQKRPPQLKILPFSTPPPREEYSEAEKERRLREWRERGFYEATK